MPRIKKKEEGRIPKTGRQRAAPDRAGRMMKQAYLKKRAQDGGEQEYDAGYAADQVEHTAKWAVDEITADVPAAIKRKSVQIKTRERKPAEPPPEAQPEPAPPQAGCAVEEILEEAVLPGRTSTPYAGETAQVCRSRPNPPKTGRTEAARPRTAPASRPPEQPQEVRAPSQEPAVPRAIKARPAADRLKRRENSGMTERPAAGSPLKRQVGSTALRGSTPQARSIPQRSRITKRNQRPVSGESPTLEEARSASSAGDRRRNMHSASPQARRRDAGGRRRAPKARQPDQTGHGRTKGLLKTRSSGAKPKYSPANRAKQTAQKQMKRQMAANTKKAVKSVAALTKRLVIAAAKSVVQAVSLLAGVVGGSVLLVALICVIVIAAVASSPFGLFFAEEKNAPDTVSVAEAVGTVNTVYNASLEAMQSGDYDSIVVHGQAADWPEVLAVFAVKLAGADLGGMDVATLDAQRVDKLTDVFWDMTVLTSEIETVEHETEEDGWTETILHITITPKSADDMRTAYAFTDYQNSALDELLGDRAALASLAGSLQITNADVQKVLANLPEDISQARRDAVETALSLVGKVNYFWGGKSHAIGWDSRWGTLQKVTAAGSPSSGTYRPYGLDCSGFVDWIFNNSLNYIIGHGGGVIMQHRYCTDISQSMVQPGDLAFYPDDSHVGIIVGWNEAGKLLVCHCSSGQNNVVVTEFSASGFTAVGRPDIFNPS